MPDRFDSVQLAMFLHAQSPLDALGLWSLAFNGSPTAFQTVGPGNTQAQGASGDTSTTIVVQPGRADFVLQRTSSNPPQHPPAAFLSLDPVLEEGLRSVRKTLKRLSVGRVACVINGTEIVENARRAVETIARQVPNLPITPEATDVNYQLTVPIASKVVSTRRLIRLCRWQSSQMQTISVSALQTTIVQQTFASLLYVDVFGEAMESLDEDAAMAALKEVTDEAKKLILGGFDALN